jgi:hypothetical protein
MVLTCGAVSNAGQAGRRGITLALVGAAKGIGAISGRLQMADCCVYGIYRLREGRHSGDSRPDIADEVHDAGTVGVFLLESILDALGICQGRVWAVYLRGVDSHELDKLPDLVEGLCLYLGAFRTGMASVLCRGMIADGDVLSPELAYLVFLAHC